jgi:hypothetical protein
MMNTRAILLQNPFFSFSNVPRVAHGFITRGTRQGSSELFIFAWHASDPAWHASSEDSKA